MNVWDIRYSQILENDRILFYTAGHLLQNQGLMTSAHVKPILFFLAVSLRHRPPQSCLRTCQLTCWNTAPSDPGSESSAPRPSQRGWSWEKPPLSRNPHSQIPKDSRREELWRRCLQHAGSAGETRGKYLRVTLKYILHWFIHWQHFTRVH